MNHPISTSDDSTLREICHGAKGDDCQADQH
jgi:hypothetical protein